MFCLVNFDWLFSPVTSAFPSPQPSFYLSPAVTSSQSQQSLPVTSRRKPAFKAPKKMKRETLIRSASFNPKVCQYWLLSGVIICLVTVIGIPFLLFWIPLGLLLTRRYLEKMECSLYTRSLVVKKGILTQTEKTIPLEKITDLGLVQGPIMRSFGIHTLSVETAGQSSSGALISLTGIEDVLDFREDVLNQRDRIEASADSDGDSPADVTARKGNEALILGEIRDILQRIERRLEEKAD